jgi:hypothetical protein
MAAQQHRWRSQFAEFITQHGYVRGTLQERLRVYGKPNCRRTRGQRRRVLYLVMSKQGRSQQLQVKSPRPCDGLTGWSIFPRPRSTWWRAMGSTLAEDF